MQTLPPEPTGILHLPWLGHAPRTWQLEALGACLSAIEQGKHGILHAVTGAGKSVFIAEFLAQLPPGTKALVTCPTQSLVEQMAETLRRRLPKVGTFYQHAHDLKADVLVVGHASLQALAAEPGLAFDVWVLDCH